MAKNETSRRAVKEPLEEIFDVLRVSGSAIGSLPFATNPSTTAPDFV